MVRPCRNFALMGRWRVPQCSQLSEQLFDLFLLRTKLTCALMW
uniref:Uncharacterized protein n=1 Tax=Arundo donax TaxID=35708 RepID=A0A0A9GLS7_ARUDO